MAPCGEDSTGWYDPVIPGVIGQRQNPALAHSIAYDHIDPPPLVQDPEMAEAKGKAATRLATMRILPEARQDHTGNGMRSHRAA